GGRGVAGVCSVLATGLMAATLPVEQFGLVVLLHTYIKVVKGFINVRTFEAIVRYGIPLQEVGDGRGLMSLLRATLFLDIGVTVLATVAAVAAVPLAAVLLHWDGPVRDWAFLYSLLLLSSPNYTGNGILRLYDRFDLLGMLYVVDPAVRVLLFVVLWAVGADVLWFVMARGAAFAVGNLSMIARGFLELYRQSTTAFWPGGGWSDLRSRDREFWGFIGVVYWQTGIDFLPKHVSTLAVGSLLGPAAAGLFQLAREISTVMSTPAMMLREVMFPELTRAWIENREHFWRLSYRAALITGAAGLLLVTVGLLAGRPLLGLVGSDYVAAHGLIVLFLVAGTFELASASLRAALYAMGRAARLLRIHVLGVGLYFGLLVLFTYLFGLIGSGIAAVAASLLTLSLTFLLFRS
ncbi:MAG: hypothetical protein RQ826_17210, partial [Xanthomonadales bacterium]|nr:hypothetical protein [Xanthomonadales bacterium]